MKSQVLRAVAVILMALLPLSTTVSAQDNLGRLEPVKLKASCDDFRSNKDITKSVTLDVRGRLQITLCSNPSTGYQWSDSAQISDHTVLWQTSHTTSPSDSGALGAPSQERWTFQALHQGTTTLSLQYARSWKGKSPDNWTFRVNVKVVEEKKADGSKGMEKVGEELVREIFKDIENSDITALKKKMAKSFQAVHSFGASDLQQEIKTLQKLQLGEYTLSDFKVTHEDQLLIVTYNVKAEETIKGERIEDKPIPRLSVFVKKDSGWKWIAHANLSS